MPRNRKNPVGADDSLHEMLDRLSKRDRGRTFHASPPPAADPGRPPVATSVAPLPLLPGPSEWLPPSAGLWIWGAGQMLNGQRPLALLFFVLELLVVAVCYCLLNTWAWWSHVGSLFGVEEPALRTTVAAAGIAVPLLTVVTVAQASLASRRRPGSRPYQGPAILPALASAVVPGWGQIVNGHLIKAMVFLSVWLLAGYGLAVATFQPALWARVDPFFESFVGVPLISGALGVGVLLLLTWALGVHDAFVTAGRR